MEIIDPQQKREYAQRHQNVANHPSTSRTAVGAIVVLVGLILLLRAMGVYFPNWILSWQMLLIAIGVIAGWRSRFAPGGWMIPILVGILFLVDRWLPGVNLRPYFWPVVIIAIGIVLLTIKGSRHRLQRPRGDGLLISSEEELETVTIFGGVKKNIISKHFKGGEITCVLGETEVNLLQADFSGEVKLEVTQVLGSTKLVIPSTWQLKTESTAILGSVEDARLYTKENVQTDKVLILEGTTILGSIVIRSY